MRSYDPDGVPRAIVRILRTLLLVLVLVLPHLGNNLPRPVAFASSLAERGQLECVLSEGLIDPLFLNGKHVVVAALHVKADLKVSWGEIGVWVCAFEPCDEEEAVVGQVLDDNFTQEYAPKGPVEGVVCLFLLRLLVLA